MPRFERVRSNTGIYHVMLRGISQQLIFEEPEDFEAMLRIIAKVQEICGFTLFAYCLMDNHCHFLLKEGTESISHIMSRIGTRYAHWFNQKYERHGHLFQNRYKSEPVETNAYFLTALLYIYQNPVAAGICSAPEEYKWSSRRFLGTPFGIADNDAIARTVSLETVKKREHTALDVKPFSHLVGRSPKYSDAAVLVEFRRICGAQSGADFHVMPKDQQKAAIQALRSKRVPIRQIARVTGLGRGIVERLGK